MELGMLPDDDELLLQERLSSMLRQIPISIFCRDYEEDSTKTDEGVDIRKLFVGNLAERTTTKDLQQLFSKYGLVESCYMRRNNGNSHFAFVTFKNVWSALEARKDAKKMRVKLHCRILRVSSADSWHQPDNIENQKHYGNKGDIKNNPQEVVEVFAEENSPMNKLNDDCLVAIFLHLPIADRIRMERVCKRWHALSRISWHAVKQLDLKNKTWGLSARFRLPSASIDTPTLRKVLIRCGEFLTHIDLSESPFKLGSSTLTIVGKLCPNLQYVNVIGQSITPSGINSLIINCKNISEFIMEGLSGPCEKNLSALFSSSKKLKHISTSDEHIIGKCLHNLPSETMEKIGLIHCTSLLSNYFNSAIKKFTALQSLTMRSCVCLNDSSLVAIGNMITLKSLALNGKFPSFSASSLNNLSRLVNLEQLYLYHNELVNDEILTQIAATCKQLNFLDISGCTSVTNAGISSIATLPKLETLSMNFVTKVTDESIASLQSLKVLRCWKCTEIHDPGIITLLKVAPELKLLDLSGTSITNFTIESAIVYTKQRKNNVILKMIIGGTKVEISEVSGISPMLQLVNLDMSKYFYETCQNPAMPQQIVYT